VKDVKKTFVEKLYECNLHKQRLMGAKKILEKTMPLTLEHYNKLDDLTLSVIDQMIYRYSKLQDSLGEKVFSGILQLNEENVKKMTFIDRVNRLEELGLVDKEEWFSLRKYRNEVIHEYSFNKADVVEGINLIFQKIDNLLQVFDNIFKYCFKRFEFVADFFSNSQKL